MKITTAAALLEEIRKCYEGGGDFVLSNSQTSSYRYCYYLRPISDIPIPVRTALVKELIAEGKLRRGEGNKMHCKYVLTE